MNQRPTLLFYCQHAMGMGHLVRSLALATALMERFRVVFVNGGVMPTQIKLPDGLELINLPPLGLDDGYLVSRDGADVEQAKTDRRQIILKSFRTLQPEVLLIELFPFGRKKFEFELLPLLDEAKNQPEPALVLCSIRDILVSRLSNQAKFEERAVAVANRYFDAILVHADSTFARLEESLRDCDRLTPTVHYSGFVTATRPERASTVKRGSVLVSAGGGLYGAPLFKTVIAAGALLTKANDPELKVVAGPFFPDVEWEALRSAADDASGIELVRSVSDLFEEMCGASASISQCGYNTALEILQTGVSALVVPFADRGEDEQIKRARRLEGLGVVRVMDQNNLTPERMAEEIRALPHFQPKALQLNMNGAQCSADIVETLAHARTSSAYRQASGVSSSLE